MHKKAIIAIDGPAGAGKSTLARRLADRLRYIYIDTGAMYRAFGLKCLRNGISPEQIDEIKRILDSTNIELGSLNDEPSVYLDGENVTKIIRTPEAGNAASLYSAIGIVRRKMIDLQRRIGERGGVVMDGRDIGTVVFPEADLKIFLDADTKTRAIRRYRELKGSENEPDISSPEFQKLLEEQIRRDEADTVRNDSPLKPAKDAIIINSTSMTMDEVLEKVLSFVKNGFIKEK